LASLSALLAVVLVLSGCGGDTPPSSEASPLIFSRGPVPDSARRPNGEIDLSQVPDFIPALDGDRQAGWIWAAAVLPPEGEPRVDIVPVYADDLVTVVGHMYPGVGFVGIGEEDKLLAERLENRQVQVRIRNDLAVTAILEIIEAPDESAGPPRLVAPPFAVEAGAEQQVVLRAPQDRWAVRLRGGSGFLYNDKLARQSADAGATIIISADGELSLQAANSAAP
jgi:hypothetical protein